MIQNKEKLRERFLRDPLPQRLDGLAATLGRVSSTAHNSFDPLIVQNRLLEARYFKVSQSRPNQHRPHVHGDG